MMLPFQQRVVVERDELRVKRDALAKFLESNPDGEMFPAGEHLRLTKQLGFMSDYLEVLQERIAHFVTA